MSTAPVSDFFTVAGVKDMFVQGRIEEYDEEGLPTRVDVLSVTKHGVEIEISDSEKWHLAMQLVMKARAAQALEEDSKPEIPEEDVHWQARARWGCD